MAGSKIVSISQDFLVIRYFCLAPAFALPLHWAGRRPLACRFACFSQAAVGEETEQALCNEPYQKRRFVAGRVGTSFVDLQLFEIQPSAYHTTTHHVMAYMPRVKGHGISQGHFPSHFVLSCGLVAF
jgi:hypothetical protein